MAYKVIILYQLYMPSYFLGTFTEYPFNNQPNNHSKAIISNHFNTFSSQSVSLHFPL